MHQICKNTPYSIFIKIYKWIKRDPLEPEQLMTLSRLNIDRRSMNEIKELNYLGS